MRTNTKYIVIHSAATKASMDVNAKEIDRWHRARGFLKIGYHFVILRDGTIEVGRDMDDIGAHCRGFNKISVGVCIVGGLSDDGEAEDNFTDVQKENLRTLLFDLQAYYPEAEIKGHRELKKGTECPSFSVEDFVNDTFI